MTTTLNLYKHQRFHLKLSVILFWSCPLFYECYYRHGALNTVEWGRIHKKETAFKLFDNLKLEYSQIKQFEISWYSKSFSSFEFSDCINAFLAWKKKNFNIRLMSSSNTGNKWYVLRCLCCCWCTFIIHVGGKARWKAMLVCWTLIWTKISQQVLNSF